MSQYQKAAMLVLWTSIISLSWLANVFLSLFVKVDGQPILINPELQGIAITNLVLIFGISTPIGSTITKGAKKVSKNIGKAFK